MKNVTVSLDEDTWRRARVRAAETGRSLSALVRDYLRELGDARSAFEQAHERELALREQLSGGFRAGDRLTRDEAHGRRP